MARILNFKGNYAGLDSARAEKNLALYGRNTETRAEEPHRGFKPAKVFLSVRFFLMLAAAVILFFDNNIAGGTLLLLLTGAYCIIEVYKGTRCDEILNEMTRATDVMVRVVRDSVVTLQQRESIVQDDLIILQGGENVPADAHLMETIGVTADESAFTGDNAPVKKEAGADGKKELKQSCIYKGTKIVSGILIARVFATGQDTRLHYSENPRKESYYTGFETAINKVAPYFDYGALILLVIAAAVQFIFGEQPEHEPLQYFTRSMMPALSFALCALPVNLSSIVRIYYIRGAVKLAEKYGNARNLRALESLNSITAICVGKECVFASDSTRLVGENSANTEVLTRIASLSCGYKPADDEEKAIFLSAAFKHIDIDSLRGNTLIETYSATEKQKISGCLWEVNGVRLLCVKGAPETVLSFCKPPQEGLFTIQNRLAEYAREGCRITAVAFAQLSDENYRIPETLYEVEYTYVGLLAFAEQIKENIAAAVKSCYRAGVKVIMLTPDDAETASAVAQKIGMKKGGVVTGSGLEKEAKFGEKAESGVEVNVYAGLNAAQKADAVRRLRKSGEIVAAFGSESSDTDVLLEADVGIALSKFTTEPYGDWEKKMNTLSQATTGAACEVCDIIMEGDGFNKVSSTLREARQMHRNIKRCISAAISAFAALMAFAVVNYILKDGFVPDAVFISLLSVIIIPVVTLAFIVNAADIKSPFSSSGFIGKGVVNKNFVFAAAIQGFSLFLAELILYLAFSKYATELHRTVFAAVFVSALIGMVYTGLSFEKPFYRLIAEVDKSAHAVCGSLLLFVVLISYIPFVNAMFGLGLIHPLVFILAVAAGLISQLWFDFIKKRFKN